MEYLVFILININLYIVLSCSLNLIMGFTGLISVAHAAYMAIGAYATTILVVNYNWNFLWTLPIVILLAMFVSAFFAIPSLRVKGDHYIVVSFGIQFIIFSLLINLENITHGANGFAGIPRPEIFGIQFRSNFSCLILSFIFMMIAVFFMWRLSKAPFGLILKAIREDEVATESLGKEVVRYKVLIYMIGCSIAALAGSFFATIISFIDPFSFTLDESIFLVALMVIGGSGTIKGSVLGVPLLMIFPEAMRFLDIPTIVAGPLRQIFYGLMIVIFMRFRPQGIISEY